MDPQDLLLTALRASLLYFFLISVIALWHFVNEWASYRSQRIDAPTAGKPAVLLEHGRFDHQALARERLNREEVLAQMRLQGIDDTSQWNKWSRPLAGSPL